MFFSQIDKKAAVYCVPVFSKWEAKFDEVLPTECQPQVQGTQVTDRKFRCCAWGEGEANSFEENESASEGEQ